MTKKEKLIDLLQNMTYKQLLSIHTEYCYEHQCYDDLIYDADQFDEVFEGMKPFDIALRIQYGDFNAQADYFTFNGYGNIQSIFNYQLSDYIYENEIADYIIDNDNDFSDDEIREILDEEDDEE